MGEPIVTLEDLLYPGLRAVCVGINPAPPSVAAGHYYRGRLGRQFFARLRAANVLPASFEGFADDAAFAAGIGFTDIVKRPTPSASEVRRAEIEYGAKLLDAKLREHKPGLVIFTFKRTAQALFGDFAGNGFVPGLELGGTDVFIMPAPYEKAETAASTIRHLAAHVDRAVPRT
jgi:TDG/mug DNA glycosylase family protein